MTAPVTVFTYGDPDRRRAEAIGAYLLGASEGNGATVLGQTLGTGTWGGETETAGTLVVAGLRLAEATRLAAHAADTYYQDAVGVVHDAEGRTLATPGATTLATAEEVWA